MTGIEKKKTTFMRLLLRFLMITLGAVIAGFGLEEFLISNRIIDGGVVGISIMGAHLTGMRLGVLIFILNIPFFYMGYKQIGKTFAVSTIYGVAALSISTTYFHHLEPITKDDFLAPVFGGILVGLGVGLVIRAGGTLDGTETLALLISKVTPFSVGEIIMAINFFIFTMAGFIFSWESAMFSFIAYFIASKVIDVVVEGLDDSRSVMIISDHPVEIGAAIMARLGRGVTYLNGEGGFTNENKKVIYCVITRLEETKLKSLMTEIDREAFIAITAVSEVKGGRVKKRNVH